jgi:hypothetical protein
MKYNNNFQLIALMAIIAFIVSFGCKKDDLSGKTPQVTFISPLSSEVFNIYDTVSVNIQVSHTQIIKRVTLTIVDVGQKPVVSGKSFEIGTSDFKLSEILVIEDRYLEDNKYFVLIKVEDEFKVFNYWREIQIRPIDKAIEKLLVVTKSLNHCKLFGLSGSSSQNILHEWMQDYLQGYADSRFMKYYICGNAPSIIRAVNFDENLTDWEQSFLSGNNHNFIQCFDGVDGYVTIGTAEGIIETFDESGQRLLRSQIDGSGVFTSIIKSNDFVVAAYRQFTDNMSTVYVINFPAGNIFYSTNILGEVKGIIRYDSGDFLLIVQDTERVTAHILSTTNKQLLFLHELSVPQVDRVEGNKDNVFIGTINDIFWYRPSTGSSVKYAGDKQNTAFAFDEVNNQLFVGSGNQILLYILPQTSSSRIWQFSDQVVDVNIQYNK